MYYIKIPYLNLDKTYDTNLCTGWFRVREGKYFIVDGVSYVTVEQGNSDNFGFSCSESEFYNHWYNYFDLNTDYVECNYKVRYIGKQFKRAAVRGIGIRIPQQDFRQVLVRQVFNEKFSLVKSLVLEGIFRQAIGDKHKNTIRGAGLKEWYALPSNNEIIKRYKKATNIFRKFTTNEAKADIIWCLKTIKSIILLLQTDSSLSEYVLKQDNTNLLIGKLIGCGLDYDSARWICIKCFGRSELFVIDDTTNKAIENIGGDIKYDDAEDFADWNLVGDMIPVSAYFNEIIKWDYRYPPRPGDDLLWV